MRIAITGSKFHRVWKCPASAVLPQIDSDDDGHGPARTRGQRIHAYLERVGQVGEEAALAEYENDDHDDHGELLPLLRAIDVGALPTHLATEVAFAWNWRTRSARELGRGLNRAYSVSPEEIPCTLDLVGVGADVSRGYVGDYKSGHSKFFEPDKFGQLLLGALCVRDVYRLDEVVVELLHIHSDGDHHRARGTLDTWDLDVFATEVANTMDLVAHWEHEYASGRAVAAHEGPHCEHCNAFNACPAKTALIRAFPAALVRFGVQPETTEDGKLVLAAGAITAANASDLWMLLERLTDVIERAKAEICGIAALGDIPLPDGRVIGRLITERRALDGRIGAEVLEERYGRATRDEFVELKLSISAVQQAVTRNLKPGQRVQTRSGDGVLDKVLAEIDRRGGMSLNTTDSIKPHVPRKKVVNGH